jgi:hypothetical protein
MASRGEDLEEFDEDGGAGGVSAGALPDCREDVSVEDLRTEHHTLRLAVHQLEDAAVAEPETAV